MRDLMWFPQVRTCGCSRYMKFMAIDHKSKLRSKWANIWRRCSMSSNEVQVRKGYVSIDGIEYVPMPTLEDLRAKLGAARQRERKLREALQQCEGLLAEVTRLELSTAPGDVVDQEGGYAGQNKNMLVDGRVWEAEKGE